MAEKRSDDGMLSTDAKLTEFVNRVKETAAGNVQSIILYGSAARGDFQESHSDLNLLCVMGSLSVEELGRVAPVVRWWCVEQQEPAPLFFTAEELHESADVFAIEMLDMQDSRRVLYGKDVIAEIKVPTNLHRVQVEHELRSIILKLRNQYLRAPGNAEQLAPIVKKSFSGVLVLLRHVIIDFGEEPPASAHGIIARAAALTESDLAPFERALEMRKSGVVPGDITPLYGEYLLALQKVIRALDKCVPKKEWQRTGRGKFESEERHI